MKPPPFLALAFGLAACAAAAAETPRDFLARFEGEARNAAPAFVASPSRGADFFRRAGARDWRCSTCHTDNPARPGKHTKTGKAIEPLAPVANHARFTRADKVDKWFKRNCNDVLERACTPAEKADLVAYLLSVAQ